MRSQRFSGKIRSSFFALLDQSHPGHLYLPNPEETIFPVAVVNTDCICINSISMDRALQRRTQRQPTPRGRRPPPLPSGGGLNLALCYKSLH